MNDWDCLKVCAVLHFYDSLYAETRRTHRVLWERLGRQWDTSRRWQQAFHHASKCGHSQQLFAFLSMSYEVIHFEYTEPFSWLLFVLMKGQLAVCTVAAVHVGCMDGSFCGVYMLHTCFFWSEFQVSVSNKCIFTDYLFFLLYEDHDNAVFHQVLYLWTGCTEMKFITILSLASKHILTRSSNVPLQLELGLG